MLAHLEDAITIASVDGDRVFTSGTLKSNRKETRFVMVNTSNNTMQWQVGYKCADCHEGPWFSYSLLSSDKSSIINLMKTNALVFFFQLSPNDGQVIGSQYKIMWNGS